MARASATASLGLRIGLAGKKGFASHDAASPHHSFTLERELSESLTDEELAERAKELHTICEKMVTQQMNDEIEKIKGMPVSGR